MRVFIFLCLSLLLLNACKKEKNEQANPNFMSYLTLQQFAPAEFGLQVLKQEMACAELKIAMNTAYHEMNELIKRKASDFEIQIATERFNEAKATYQAKQKEIESMLAAIGMGSPAGQ